MLFLEEISVKNIKSASKESAEYNSHIPTDRLIHIMRLGREMQRIEWDILDAYLSGQPLKSIGDSLDINQTTVWRKLRKISEKMQHSVLG